MRNLVFILTLVSTVAIAESGVQIFGETMPEEPASVSIGQAIESYKGQSGPMKLSGKITEVCQKKGCWMVLTEGETYARVRFKDYGFFVPVDSGQLNAVVYGTLSAIELSEDQANHYAEDAGSDERFPDGKQEFAIMASSVVIYADSKN